MFPPRFVCFLIFFPKMPDGTSVMSREFEASEVGEDVVKLGRSTGQTLGRVILPRVIYISRAPHTNNSLKKW